MTTLNWAPDTVYSLAEGFQKIETQHALYREQMLQWIQTKVVGQISAIIKSPLTHSSVFWDPDEIKIAIFISKEEFWSFFGIPERDKIRLPIRETDEIQQIVQDAIKQPGYTVTVGFWDWWPHDENTWFNIQLKKQLNKSIENPSN